MIGNYGLDNKKLAEDEENKLSKLRQSDYITKSTTIL